MDLIDFNFKKSRKLGDLLSDYITLFKQIFKHFNKTILALSLPFIAIFMLITFYFFSYFSEMISSSQAPSFFFISSIFFPTFLFLMLFFLLVSTFGIEYMLLLEEKGNTDFSTKDIFRNIKLRITKYIAFFFSSLVVGLMLMIPFGIIAVILAFIPLVGMIALGVLSSMMAMFFYCALFLYLQNRERLWDSYRASFYLIKKKLFEYGLAAYIFQMIMQILLGLLTIVPLIILGIIAFNTIGFNDQFFTSFSGKFLVSLGSSIFTLFIIMSSIYMISFYVLQYFSLLEVSYREDTLDNIDQIGKTVDDF